MKIHLPNSAHLHNLGAFVSHYAPGDPNELAFSMHDRWVSVHPVALAMAACAGRQVRLRGGIPAGTIHQIRALPYLIRMGLFEHLGIDPGRQITAHEEAGRFVPLMQVTSAADLRNAITNLVPLLHVPKAVADPIRYVFSEMVRNVLEHAASPVGAMVCAQYYRNTERISIGIADAGIGIKRSMARSHAVVNHRQAIELALQPGVTGTTSRIGGNEFNAGAGLFFTKSIAALSRNFFVLYSGDALFKLLRTPEGEDTALNADPREDRHRFQTDLPLWQGTVVGIDINVDQTEEFADLLEEIRKAYSIDVRGKKKLFHKKIHFVK